MGGGGWIAIPSPGAQKGDSNRNRCDQSGWIRGEGLGEWTLLSTCAYMDCPEKRDSDRNRCDQSRYGDGGFWGIDIPSTCMCLHELSRQ